MLQDLLITLYVLVQTTFCGCGADKRASGFEKITSLYRIERIGKLPEGLGECSGLALGPDSSLLALNDGGNPAMIYRITRSGQLLEKIQLPGTRNLDWEDLAQDTANNLYIGDFGNNANNRTNLTVYKLATAEPGPEEKTSSQIRFSYPDLVQFPPADKTQRNFDCEAFFWLQGQLYLFSKDWGTRRKVKLYSLPDAPGNYTANLLDSLQMRTLITAADISPDRKTAALLSYGKIYLFALQPGVPLFQSPRSCIRYSRSAQAEALVFINNTDFIFANEQGSIFLAKKKRP